MPLSQACITVTLIITDNSASVESFICGFSFILPVVCSSWRDWEHLWLRAGQCWFPVSETSRQNSTVALWGLLQTKNPIRVISVAGSLRTCPLSLSVHSLSPEIFPQRPGAPQRRRWWSTWWVLPSGLVQLVLTYLLTPHLCLSRRRPWCSVHLMWSTKLSTRFTPLSRTTSTR